MAQIARRISPREFHRLVRPALGLRVSHPWLGTGKVLFLELGDLHTEVTRLPKFGTRRHRVGQAGILFHSLWRAESPRRFLFGSGSSKARMKAGVNDLKGRRITAIQTEGGLPELVVELDRRVRIRGFSSWRGPDWDLRLDDAVLFPRGKPWIRADHKLYVGYDDDRGLYRALCYSPKIFSVTP